MWRCAQVLYLVGTPVLYLVWCHELLLHVKVNERLCNQRLGSMDGDVIQLLSNPILQSTANLRTLLMLFGNVRSQSS